MESSALSWQPSPFAQWCTDTYDWALTFEEETYSIRINDYNHQGLITDLEYLIVNTGTFWSDFEWKDPEGKIYVLDGLPNEDGNTLVSSLNYFISEVHRKIEFERVCNEFKLATSPIARWYDDVSNAIEYKLKSKGWLPQSLLSEILISKPKLSVEINGDELAPIIQTTTKEMQTAINFWLSDLKHYFNKRNQKQLTQVSKDLKKFFNTVEKSPLSHEQINAVVCMDDNNLLVASAGSGKTSTMVAKCGYAIHMKYFKPNQILMLAFNADAAKELKARLDQRLLPLNIPTDEITANTFHKFGLDVIGLVTGRKPNIPNWLENGKDTEVLLTLIDNLKDNNQHFRNMWDLFRVVINKDLPAFGKEEDEPEWRDAKSKNSGFWTFNNELVKSRGELLIANWLFYNGVRYEYETAYEHDTTDANHGQYTPDFYFPDIGLYYEHWALDENGNPPKSFKNYAESMQWKKSLHAKHGTKLIETTMAELWSGKAFDNLANALTERGIQLAPNPDRPTPGRQKIQNERLIKLFKTFLSHVKNNQVSLVDLNRKLESSELGHFKFRHRVFLDLFASIWEAWDNKLKSEEAIDFDDMLNMAANLIEQGKFNHHYELIMVDEFQDASQSRARLIRALLKKQNQVFFAVGDDWQSINRFAGAYLGCMTDFESTFGPSTTLKLENTFRCPQSLCNISSKFVQKNPLQIKKNVRSAIGDVEKPIKIIRVSDVKFIQSAVQSYLNEITQDNLSQQKQSVYVLGRHHQEEAYSPKLYNQQLLSVEFKTIHASKGLEADYIIIPNMINHTLGFPNQMDDDPILSLAMPVADRYEFSEERRLFYVALTRAKRNVALITVENNESPFVLELIKHHKLEVHDTKGEAQQLNVCPQCNQGLIIEKEGPYGLFKYCSNYPRCDYKPKKTNKSYK